MVRLCGLSLESSQMSIVIHSLYLTENQTAVVFIFDVYFTPILNDDL